MRGFREFFAFSITAGLVVYLTLAAYAFTTPFVASLNNLYASRFDTMRSYKQVVPIFIDAAVEIVDSSGVDLTDTGDWIDEMEAMFPEFLSDMILVQKAMSEQTWDQYSVSPVQAFSAKWSARLAACPDCEELVPLLKPLVDELFEEFPHPIWRTSDIPPLGYNFEPYKRLERWDPWEVGAFFGFEWLEERQGERLITEKSRERTDQGSQRVYVAERSVVQTREQQQIFYEHILDDEVVSVGVVYDPVTMLHQLLNELITHDEDPKLIRVLSRMVRIVDESIAQVKDNGLMDEETYNYLYNPTAVLNRIIQNKHPLMDAPYNTEYKVAEFYPLPPIQGE